MLPIGCGLVVIAQGVPRQALIVHGCYVLSLSVLTLITLPLTKVIHFLMSHFLSKTVLTGCIFFVPSLIRGHI